MVPARWLFRGKQRVYAYRWLAGTLRQNSALDDSLLLLWSHATDDGRKPRVTQAQAFEDWAAGVRAGKTFGSSVARWVPSSHRMLLEAGESAQMLPGALLTCAWLEEVTLEMRRQLIGALAAPLLVLGLTFAIVAFFGLRLAPALDQIAPMDEWDGVAAFAPHLFSYVLDGGLVWTLLALVASAVLLVSFVLPRWTSRARGLLEWWLPFRLYRMFTATFFLVALTGLIDARRSFDEACTLLGNHAPPWFRSKMVALLVQLRAGLDLGEALWAADPYFPDKGLNRELRTVFTLDDANRIVRELTEDWVEKAKTELANVSGLLKLAAQVTNALVLAVLILSMFQVVMTVSR